LHDCLHLECPSGFGGSIPAVVQGVNLSCRLTLLQEGGHIGYDVAPSQRGRGYGHLALRVALDEAARRAIPRVLLYTSEDNLASRAVIERAGGVLESVAYSDFWNEPLCKYWLSVGSEG